ISIAEIIQHRYTAGTMADVFAFDRLMQIKFNVSELVSVVIEKEFDFHRAGRWMDDHIIFTFQASFLYLITIFSIKQWMSTRERFTLKYPVATWNLFIAALSGVCAAAMSPEFFGNIYHKGFGGSVCDTQQETFSGNQGRALFLLLIARLPEFIDTFFIVLKKQPLLFIHYFHHAFTLCMTWGTYSYFAPGSRHAIYVNSLIHTVMYSYYFLTSLNVRPPPFVARSITIGQIVQFFYIFYTLVHLTVLHATTESCQQDSSGLALTWFMDLTYLYLFIDFYLNKYKGEKKPSQKAKKVE
ncbi:hypothetical protein PMAYCL1PPCAC_30618, partial [Pristionchus mayeri]